MTLEHISVLLVDDHELIRQGLARAFERAADITVVAEAGSLGAAMDLARETEPQVVVTDVRLPDGSGLELVKALRRRRPDVGLVVLTMYAGDDQLFAAMEAGASAFVAKDAPASDVVAAARQAARAPHTFAAVDLAAAMRRRLGDDTPRLSDRELEVLRLLADGSGIVEVARRLYVSESTAKSHVSNIYVKLGAANRAQAIMQAVRQGLLPHD